MQAKKSTNDFEKGLHCITCNVAGLRRWNKFKDNIYLLFEAYGKLIFEDLNYIILYIKNVTRHQVTCSLLFSLKAPSLFSRHVHNKFKLRTGHGV